MRITNFIKSFLNVYDFYLQLHTAVEWIFSQSKGYPGIRNPNPESCCLLGAELGERKRPGDRERDPPGPPAAGPGAGGPGAE